MPTARCSSCSCASIRASSAAGSAAAPATSAGEAAERRRPARRRSGEAGVNGGPSGDLYIVVIVAEHEFFERHDNDLFCEIPIKFSLACLGGTIHVPTLFGKGNLKIAEGTQTGTVFRLRGQGMPHLRGNGQGDLLVRVQVEVPKKLTKEQREKLLELVSL